MTNRGVPVIVSLGPMTFEENIVKSQLRRDLRDDWFPDPLLFEDMLEAGNINSVLTDNFQNNDGIFLPKPRTLLNIPKTNFTLRYGLEISLAERALYHALTMRLVPHYDPLIPWNIFNHRESVDPKQRYLFRRAIPAWQDFTGVVNDTLSTSSVLLSTDLVNYFENINLKKLRCILVGSLAEIDTTPNEKAEIRIHIDMLFEYLKSWCYSETAGLPQNRDASSFLANVYMLPVDRAMLDKGYHYFRYMDDIKITCDNEHHARRALKVLSLELRKLGLSVNGGKTAIVRGADHEAIGMCLDRGNSELQQIDSIWQTRSLRPIKRSFSLLSDLTKRQLQNGQVGGRIFRYCIRRLEVLARCPEFEAPDEYFSDITPLVVNALSQHPAATDELARYIRAVPTSAANLRGVSEILQDETKNYYTWQNYRLWVLLIQKEYRDDALLDYAMDVVKTQEDNATRCGATLYAGAFGNKANRIEIAKRFGTLESFLGQRTAVLAVQELHYRPHVHAHIEPRLRNDLKDVYRNLRRKGQYIAPPLPVSITQVLDRERDYD